MFYEHQPDYQKNNYKKILKIVGSLSRLQSQNDAPYLYYRTHENAFCKYFNAENLGRFDCSADAKKDGIGIGLKTWMGNDDQKVAEFGQVRNVYENLVGIELVKTIAEYRNERIRVTKNSHNIDDMIYSIVKRRPGVMDILEHSFDYINIDNISLIPDRGNQNNTYFTDGNHTYHFSKSKNTLYMIFDDLQYCDSISVEIIDDPFELLMRLYEDTGVQATGSNTTDAVEPIEETSNNNQLCLRLYSTKTTGEKFVAEKSGLNQWNASGRKRNPDELYIPYPVEDKHRNEEFFPDRNTIFNLTLPDGTTIPAKVCQDGGKAIMSNPNRVLGNWLLRKVFEVEEGTLITYEMLQRFGIDSVIFTKHNDLDYSVDFAEIGTYEKFYEHDLDE